MTETIITWNWANWITVGLMSLIFLALLAFFASLYTKTQNSGSGA